MLRPNTISNKHLLKEKDMTLLAVIEMGNVSMDWPHFENDDRQVLITGSFDMDSTWMIKRHEDAQQRKFWQ